MFKIYNYAVAPFKIIYDKTYEYTIEYFYNNNKNTNNDSETQIVKYFNHYRYYGHVSYFLQLINFFKSPTHIIDNIYIGSAFNAALYYDLKDKNIEMILNITSEISEYYPDDFKYKKYELYDNHIDSIKKYLNNAYNDIINFKNKNENGNILVHCFMGASRSVSIVIYYIMKTLKNSDGSNYSIEQALRYIKNKRIIINPTQKLLNDIIEVINLENN